MSDVQTLLNILQNSSPTMVAIVAAYMLLRRTMPDREERELDREFKRETTMVMRELSDRTIQHRTELDGHREWIRTLETRLNRAHTN